MTAWHPSASIAALKKRAATIYDIRNFFYQRDYLEVETPIMARFGVTDPYLTNINACFRGKNYPLQTSPEYHMKRLIAAGCGPIFQLARVFRDDELGRWHNPEFTLLEWYQLNIDHHQLLAELDQLLQLVLHTQPLVKKTYQAIFIESCAFDPFKTDIAELKQVCATFNLARVLPDNEQDCDQYLFLLMSHVVEPCLAAYNVPVAVYDFPASQASLAQVSHGRAQRFEVYFKGVELANGFYELTQAQVQRIRFDLDCAVRKSYGLPEVKADEYLLAALDYGLPCCSGVAVGIDRLIALAHGASSIAETMAFDFSRA